MSNCYKYDIYEVPIGWIGVISTQVGLTNCFIDSNQTTLHNRMNAFITIDETLKLNSRMLQTSITNYFLGISNNLNNISLDIPHTSPPFFKKLWEACRTIPPAETRSYGWLADQAGNKKAVRAAGQAMKKNKLPLFIPCHRVILSSNQLGNYTSGGTVMKQFLLDLESGGYYA